MSYFEYTFTGDLTPEYEEKTKLLIAKVNEGSVPYKLEKYFDEEITTDKKKRTIIVISPVNVLDHLYSIMCGCNLMYVAYFKQRLI